jgi:hypothetical protein
MELATSRWIAANLFILMLGMIGALLHWWKGAFKPDREEHVKKRLAERRRDAKK